MQIWACPKCKRALPSAGHCPNDRVAPYPVTLKPAELFPLTGQLLAGKYLMLGGLGAGGFGAVYLAVQQPLSRLVAVKLLRSASADPAVHTFSPLTWHTKAEAFLSEARLASLLSHPAIPAVLDFGECQAALYMVMEYMPGHTLAALLAERPEQRLPFPEAIRFARLVAEALATIHAAGLIHGDIKPLNVIVDPVNRRRISLVDFGLARDLAEVSQETAPDAQAYPDAGSPPYMAPELFPASIWSIAARVKASNSARSALGPQADIYALGVVLFEMIAGRRPLEPASTSIPFLHWGMEHILRQPPSLESFVGRPVLPELEQVVGRCLAKDPTERFATASELTRELDAVLASMPAATPVDLLGKPLEAENTPAPEVVLGSGPAGDGRAVGLDRVADPRGQDAKENAGGADPGPKTGKQQLQATASIALTEPVPASGCRAPEFPAPPEQLRQPFLRPSRSLPRPTSIVITAAALLLLGFAVTTFWRGATIPAPAVVPPPPRSAAISLYAVTQSADPEEDRPAGSAASYLARALVHRRAEHELPSGAGAGGDEDPQGEHRNGAKGGAARSMPRSTSSRASTNSAARPNGIAPRQAASDAAPPAGSVTESPSTSGGEASGKATASVAAPATAAAGPGPVVSPAPSTPEEPCQVKTVRRMVQEGDAAYEADQLDKARRSYFRVVNCGPVAGIPLDVIRIRLRLIASHLGEAR